jgi:type IV secretory pathway VirB4 component
MNPQTNSPIPNPLGQPGAAPVNQGMPAPIPVAPVAPVVSGQQPQVNLVAPPTQMAAPVSNPNSTQNTLQIAEVRDGIVIMNDGSFRSVIMVKSINFDLMSAQEQEAVEYSYQGFLNSLYFPIQIFERSQKIDLQPYIQKLDKIRTEHDNMLLALLMEDYIGYIDALSQQTNIMDKKFYVVIPFFPVVDTANKAVEQSKNFITGFGSLFNKQEQHITINEAELENAKTELRNRVQAVLSGLLQCGIKGIPLDTQELIELYYDTYNPDTATRQHLKNFENLTADVVVKGDGLAPQAHLQRELQ